MRLHISIDDDLVDELDARVGARRRSWFIERAVRRALEEELRWTEIEAAYGSIRDSGHEWDTDPASWVRAQRAADPQPSG